MGVILSFFGAGGALAPGMLARLQALVIAAIALLAMVLALTTWALLERSGRLSAKADLIRAQDQAKIWEDAAGRCTASVQALGKAGEGAVAETKRLLAMAETALQRNAAVREEIRGIVRAPTPKRTDGSDKNCQDALAEIKAKVKP